jgi:hypothetical protein
MRILVDEPLLHWAMSVKRCGKLVGPLKPSVVQSKSNCLSM